jgi:toxin ParE1/3/4
MAWHLSTQASQDLEDIFDYTASEHGPDQAFKYTKTFDDKFDKLLDNPMLGRERSEIKSGLRSIVKEHHIIFYRIQDNTIHIARILHASSDLPRFFD